MTLPDRKPEKRKPLSRREFGYLLLSQEGKCACCRNKLDLLKRGQVVDEHLQPLADGGTNDLDNRALYCLECARGKTSREVTPRARSKRYAEGRTQADKRARAKEAGTYRGIGGRGFQDKPKNYVSPLSKEGRARMKERMK